MTETNQKPTLDEFIRRARTIGGSAWVTEPDFESLYVRLGPRYIRPISLEVTFGHPDRYDNVLDIANVTVEEDRRGTGVFTKLVTRLRNEYPKLHIYVENAMDNRFQQHLLKIGFIRATYEECFFLVAEGESKGGGKGK